MSCWVEMATEEFIFLEIALVLISIANRIDLIQVIQL